MKQKYIMQPNALEYIGNFDTLSVKEKTVSEPYPLHWHNFFEIEMIMDGEGVQTLNGTDYPLRRGCVTLLSPTDFHAVNPSAENPLHLYNIMFHESMLSDAFFNALASHAENTILYLSENEFAELTDLHRILKNEYQKEDAYKSEFLHNALECIIILLSRKLNFVQETHGEPQKNDIQKAVLYMQLHFKEHPTLAETAESVHLHPNYFSQRFKEVTKKTYSAYLTHLRLSYAKKLLGSTGLTVTEICFASGFTSLSNFLKVFRDNTGITPSAYRETHSRR